MRRLGWLHGIDSMAIVASETKSKRAAPKDGPSSNLESYQQGKPTLQRPKPWSRPDELALGKSPRAWPAVKVPNPVSVGAAPAVTLSMSLSVMALAETAGALVVSFLTSAASANEQAATRATGVWETFREQNGPFLPLSPAGPL